MYYLTAGLGFILVFGLVVFVHEGGHFLLARVNDVEVEAFALGMGPELLTYQPGETEYRICAVPLGGYVKLAGEDVTEETDNPRAFANQGVFSRMSILVAGVVCNILLGFFLYYPYGLIRGEEHLPAKIGYVNENMPARGKLQVGDRVLSVNGKPVDSFEDISVRNSLLGGVKRKFKVSRNGERKVVEIQPHRLEDRSVFEPTHVVGISPFLPPVIDSLTSNSLLRESGFKEGDRFKRLSGVELKGIHPYSPQLNKLSTSNFSFEIKSFQQLNRLFYEKRGFLDVHVARNGRRIEKKLAVPVADKAWQNWARSLGWSPPVKLRKYGPLEALKFAGRETKKAVRLLLQGLWGLVSRRLSPQGLTGPVGIIGVTGHIATVGFWPLLNFTAFLSINLGVINILPVPVLDGGHIFLSLPEIFGLKLPPKVFEIANRAGLTLILALLVVVTFYDLARLEFVNWLVGYFLGFLS